MSMLDLVVIVTGSTKGIGKSLVFELAKRGARVVVNGRNQTSVNEVTQQLQRLGYKAIGVVGSVDEMNCGKKLVQNAIDAFGTVNVLINNAGIVHDRMSHRMSEQEWDEVISVHLKGTFACAKPFIQYIRNKTGSGTIINMTSLAGIKGTIGQLNYSAAKAGIIGMTKTWAKELKSSNITVYAIAPAAYTDMTASFIDEMKEHPEMSSYWNVGSADDVARFITALLEQNGQFLSGEVFTVNGQQIGRWHEPVHEILSENGSKDIFKW
ncbi:SDR family NAD(P)-dependent oxidoreductase [Halalkalibacter urbisdiaboli]|uniref:SDR family NAD(P)-dependent oxidoreductase n=1 Tax=Halalkalibacter urbisdiaboli TaxID=1960589 RepID=UPI000B432E91|nr:SDR family NAD(P)-dependent oxidoreductase [Halalkalibacter urbisdiaboli]